MRIGIDFDNTIAWYDNSFRQVALKMRFINESWKEGGKKELRDHLREQTDGEKTWMRLQGLIYGKYMHHAEIMPGVTNFLLRCKARDHEVFIISHKTEFGHFDPEKISLRDQALKWMRNLNFFEPNYIGISQSNVFFADTRQEKVERIRQAECDCFIDDLPEVFAEESFPVKTKKILFANKGTINNIDSSIPICNWEEISEILLGEVTKSDLFLWAAAIKPESYSSVKKITGRGNSRIYQLTGLKGEQYALKFYPDRYSDMRKRLKVESVAINYLNANGLSNIPEVVGTSYELNLGLYSWVEGTAISDPDSNNFKQLVNFVKQLKDLSALKSFPDELLASESCLSAGELIGQITKRISRLEAVAVEFPDLQEFLEDKLPPIWQKAKKCCVDNWPNSSKREDLKREFRVLSPSDFGYHNCLIDGGQIKFLDFEYFGWDDPVKLTADFVWHPAMNLNSEIIAKWITEMKRLFANDPDFEFRLKAAMPSYGIRWILILLNEYLPGYSKRRFYASQKPQEGITSAVESSRKIQLEKAFLFLDQTKALIE